MDAGFLTAVGLVEADFLDAADMVVDWMMKVGVDSIRLLSRTAVKCGK